MQEEQVAPTHDLSEEEEVVQNNEDYCFSCRKRGDIYCCDNCYRSFHGEDGCLPARPIEDIWSCPCCTQHNDCPMCGLQVKSKYWVCNMCERKTHYPCTGLAKKLQQDILQTESFVQKAFFICFQCIYHSEVRHIIRSQVIDDVTYHLINPHFTSYIHLSWISDGNLKLIQEKPKKHKHSLATLNSHFVKTEIDRILAVKPPLIYRDLSSYDLIHMLRDPTRKVDLGEANNMKFLVKWQNLQYHNATWEDEYVVRASKTNSLQKFLRLKEYQTYYLIDKTARIQDFRRIPQNLPELEVRELRLVQQMLQRITSHNHILLSKCISDRRCQLPIAALLCHLFYHSHVEKPFLIFTKYKEIPIWISLLEEFCPGLYVVTLTGLLESRNIIKTRELYFQKAGTPKFDVLLTTHDCFAKDFGMFYNNQITVKWELIIYDDELRCHCLINSRPGVKETAKIILTSNKFNKVEEFSLDLKLMLSILNPTIKPPLSTNYNQMLEVVLPWIPKELQYWPEFDADNKKKQAALSKYFKMAKDGPGRPKKQHSDIDRESKIVKEPRQFRQSREQREQTASQKELSQPILPVRHRSQQEIRPVIQKQQKETKEVRQGNYTIISPQIQKTFSETLAKVHQNSSRTEHPWPRYKRIAFLRFILTFGADYLSYRILFDRLLQFERTVFDNTPQELQNTIKYMRIFMSLILANKAQISQKFFFGISGFAIHRRIIDLSNLRQIYEMSMEKQEAASKPDSLFKRDDLILIKLILKHGFENWGQICMSQEWMPEGYQTVMSPFDFILHRTGNVMNIPISQQEKLRLCIKLLSARSNTILEHLRQTRSALVQNS